ncbi:hypothetical protein ACTFIZ_012867 [Dictyostelium cf. discoideum]
MTLKLSQGDCDLETQLPDEVKEELLAWKDLLINWNGKEINSFPHFNKMLVADASEEGAGCYILENGMVTANLQYNSGSIHSEPGWNNKSDFDQGGKMVTRMHTEEDHYQGSTCSRYFQPTSRSTKQTITNDLLSQDGQLRMEIEYQTLSPVTENVGTNAHRSVRVTRKPPNEQVCNIQEERLQSELEQTVKSVPLPPTTVKTESTQEIETRQTNGSDIGISKVADRGVDTNHQVFSESQSTTHRSGVVQGMSSTTIHQQNTINETREVESSNGEDLQSFLDEITHDKSEKVKHLMFNRWSQSTKATYSKQWARYTNFCKINNLEPKELKATSVMEYLTDLRDQGISFSTVKSHRSLLNQLSLWKYNVDLLLNQDLRSVISGIGRINPTITKRNRIWNPLQLLDHIIDEHAVEGGYTSFNLERAVIVTKLFGLARSSDLAKLKWSTMSLDDHSFSCQINQAKEQRTSGIQSKFELKEVGNGRFVFIPIQSFQVYFNDLDYYKMEHKEDAVFIGDNGEPLTSKDIGEIVTNYLKKAGLNTKEFTSHSTRGAMTSYLGRWRTSSAISSNYSFQVMDYKSRHDLQSNIFLENTVTTILHYLYVSFYIFRYESFILLILSSIINYQRLSKITPISNNRDKKQRYTSILLSGTMTPQIRITLPCLGGDNDTTFRGITVSRSSRVPRIPLAAEATSDATTTANDVANVPPVTQRAAIVNTTLTNDDTRVPASKSKKKSRDYDKEVFTSDDDSDRDTRIKKSKLNSIESKTIDAMKNVATAVIFMNILNLYCTQYRVDPSLKTIMDNGTASYELIQLLQPTHNESVKNNDKIEGETLNKLFARNFRSKTTVPVKTDYEDTNTKMIEAYCNRNCNSVQDSIKNIEAIMSYSNVINPVYLIHGTADVQLQYLISILDNTIISLLKMVVPDWLQTDVAINLNSQTDITECREAIAELVNNNADKFSKRKSLEPAFNAGDKFSIGKKQSNQAAPTQSSQIRPATYEAAATKIKAEMLPILKNANNNKVDLNKINNGYIVFRKNKNLCLNCGYSNHQTEKCRVDPVNSKVNPLSPQNSKKQQ